MFPLLLAIAIALLIFAYCAKSLLSSGRSLPTFATPESARKYLPIVWVIRGAEGLIFGAILLIIFTVGICFFVAVNPFRPQPGESGAYAVMMTGVLILVVTFFVAKIRKHIATFDRRAYVRGFLAVSSNSISNFAFLFAAFSAHDLYRLMPATKLPTSHDSAPLLMTLLHRDVLWLIVFFGLWHFIQFVVGRLLDMKKPGSGLSRKDPPSDSDSPEFPQKSPSVQL